MRQGQQGQAVVEYILTLLIALSLLSIIMTGYGRSVRGLWSRMAQDVAKACPKCPTPQ